MESRPDLIFTEKFYDMTREEQMEDGLRRFRIYADNFREKYFTNFQRNFVPWWGLNF